MNNASYTHIISLFRRITLRYFIIGMSTAFGFSLAVLISLFGISALAEAVLYISPAVKMPLFFFSLGIPVFLLLLLVCICIIRRPGRDEISRIIEKHYPQFNDRLISAVQLGALDEMELRGQSQELTDALIDKVNREISALDIAKAVPVSGLRVSFRSFLGTVGIFLLLAVLFPGSFPGGVYRLTDYSRSYIRPGRTEIFTTHRKQMIIRGENFTGAGFLSGKRSEQLRILYRWDDSATWNMKPVDVDETTGNFTATVEKPRVSFQYYYETDSAVSSQYAVTVIERPDIEELELTLHYPDYTGLGVIVRNDNDGNIRTLRGTVVSIKVRANKTLDALSVVWGDSTVTGCAVAGDLGTVSFTVRTSIDYRFELVDTLGITSSNPITYRITCLDDEIPSVSILSPPADIILPSSMKFPVVYRARDDYGLASVELKFKLPFEETDRSVMLKNDGLSNEITDEYLWDMSGYELLPEDIIPYNLIVYDNDTVGGPKAGISETLTVRLPSMADIFSDVIDQQDAGIERLREISERTSEQERKLDEVGQSIKNGDELEWSDKNTLEGAQQNLQRMQNDVKDISENIKRVSDNLSEENIVALETLEKLETISNIMENIAEGEMKDALKQLLTANTEIDPKKVKQALDQYKVTAEDIQKKLDRIISLLEQVKALQRFEMAKNLLEDMALKQAEITTDYRQNPDNTILPREEEMLAGEMKKIQDELLGSVEEMNEQFNLDTEHFENSIKSKDVSKIMQQASRQMSEGSTSEAEHSLNESNAMISELLFEMEQLDAMLKNSNTAEMRRRLFKSLDELLAVSNMQESLVSEMKTNDANSLARQQLDIIDALSKAERSLNLLGEIVVQLPGTLEQIMTSIRMVMENTVNVLSMGSIEAGENNARNSLRLINRTTHMLTALIQQSESGSGSGMPGDLMQQLQNIANGQLSLQQQMGSELMEQLAAEQQKLAQMLSELGEKILEDARLREMLDKLAEEMDDTSRMMQRNEERELVERKQFDIYRRLLDARRSRREKDESEERKSWTARENISAGADRLADDLGEKERDLNERIKQALNDDFDTEYMKLIRNYFESLLQDRSGREQ